VTISIITWAGAPRKTPVANSLVQKKKTDTDKKIQDFLPMRSWDTCPFHVISPCKKKHQAVFSFLTVEKRHKRQQDSMDIQAKIYATLSIKRVITRLLRYKQSKLDQNEA